ncbi:MAG: 50S ribosomal protein L22, large subunit ribosomal protein L22 [Candidatus Peregrinibacteria bacterium GW2011_GWE2_39_6]|nr:MAG: 50S ribosomal protein L22, large subunit ribosomal protein L22 [Candidatus Peregrinibacteria bacterium GW2011_GWF2_39_17]KKR26538.1 MAG: 50S ribosomal protein L22, large subunit ribosomal protein L22 [Candidatus Peregrinibacteria bacterium GW2011_GWE2_39_6]
MIAHLRKIRISPKKANLVAGLVRRKPVNEALTVLQITPKKGAKILEKVIRSASANATNNFKQSTASLIIKEIIVTEGPTYKRFQPVSRGRSHPILKRTSHITVKVETDPSLVNRAEKKSAPSLTETTNSIEEKPKKEAKEKTTKKKTKTSAK